MNDFHVIVGISGSGKNYWTQSQAALDDVVLDSDETRKILFGDPSIQMEHQKVFNYMFQEAHKALSNNQNVWYVATNLTRKHRVNLIKNIRKLHPETKFYCHIIITPPEICIARDNARSRIVGEQVIMQQLRKFSMPIMEEGWNGIQCHKNWDGSPNTYSEELWKKVADFGAQENPHHTLSLYDHCIECGVHAYRETTDLGLVVCAIYHDVGKIYTKTYWDDDTNIAHYPNHANVSAYLALCCGQNYIQALLINYHMIFYANKKDQEIWHARLGDEIWEKLTLLHKWDEAAH